MNIPISDSFKQKTTKAVFTIILFIVVYLLLLSLALGLTALCITGGFMIIVAKPMFYTLIIGLGLASIGVLILLFLIKFLFKKHTVDLSNYIEITAADQPRLFALIRSIVDEVGTHFPKKVYVSQEVNASVFYNSSFWSMFFPIKKNLHIGMGLVTTLTEDELKAILSHEFGHFSQKSMKVGSYVYNVNQVIFNILYDNESYHNLIKSWARISNYFVFFANIAIKITTVIQWVLKKMYTIVNLSYMELSREMEFHADAVAATVTGSIPLKTSLLRMDLADKSYNEVIDFYNSKIEDSLVSTNIFKEQSFVLQFIATKDKLPLVNGIPMVSETNGRFIKSKINIDNQWASHPSTADRIAKLEQLNLVKPAVNTHSATLLFDSIDSLQERLTRFVFAAVDYPKLRVNATLSDFKLQYEKEYDDKSFNPKYNGYYDIKNPILFSVADFAPNTTNLTFEDLYSEDKIDLVYQQIALQQDQNLLEMIGKGDTQIRTFDYAGVKYKWNDALELKSKNDVELKDVVASILENDKNIYAFFHQKALQKGSEAVLKEKYEGFFNYDARYDAHFAVYEKLINGLQFTNTKTPFATIESNFKALLNDEQTLKGYLKEMMQNLLYQNEITDAMKENFEKYLSKDWNYFGGQSYYETSLKMFFEALHSFQYLNHRGYFLLKKDLVEFQIGVL